MARATAADLKSVIDWLRESMLPALLEREYFEEAGWMSTLAAVVVEVRLSKLADDSD